MATFSNEYLVFFLGFSKHVQGKLIIYIYFQNNDRVHGDATVHNIIRTIYNTLSSKINIALVVYVYSQLKCMYYINVFNYLYLYGCKKYIKARVRNVLFIRGAYRTTRLNNKKVVLGACGEARARSRVL